MSRFGSLLAIALAAASGCTFNVHSVDEEVRSESAASFTRLRADLRSVGAPLDSATVVVRGVDGATSSAVVELGGLVRGGEDADAIARGVEVRWTPQSESLVELALDYSGPGAESVWVERVTLGLPVGTELDVDVGASSIDVAALEGAWTRVHAGSGSIRVRDAREVDLEAGSGSIDVVAEHGVIETGSGSIDMRLTGPVIASAGSGSIRGAFGGHGELSAGSGSITVAVVSALDGDVSIETGSGSITLEIPPGAGMRLDLDAGSGSVTVEAGEVGEHGESFAGPVNGGGAFTVRARAGSGSITVREAEAS